MQLLHNTHKASNCGPDAEVLIEGHLQALSGVQKDFILASDSSSAVPYDLLPERQQGFHS